MKGKIILGAVKIMVIFFTLLLAFGCATINNPSAKVFPKFPEEEIRNVRILLIASQQNMTVKTSIIDASNLIEPQVGLRLEISKEIIIDESFPFKRNDVIKRIVEIVEENRLMFGRDFDVAMWAGDYSIFDLFYSAIPIPLPYFWRGIMDRGICRCIIAVKSFDARIIAHEIIHGFMLDSKHGWGLEREFIIEFLPGIFLIPPGYTLSEEEKAEVIRYKWRGFPELPKNPPIALVLDPSSGP